MKKFFIGLFLLALTLAISGTSFASPFLFCDPQEGVTSYILTGPSWVPVSVPAQPDGSIKMDVAAATVGANALTVKTCKTDPVWGEQCSSTVPFQFTRPSGVAVPSNLGLIK